MPRPAVGREPSKPRTARAYAALNTPLLADPATFRRVDVTVMTEPHTPNLTCEIRRTHHTPERGEVARRMPRLGSRRRLRLRIGAVFSARSSNRTLPDQSTAGHHCPNRRISACVPPLDRGAGVVLAANRCHHLLLLLPEPRGGEVASRTLALHGPLDLRLEEQVPPGVPGVGGQRTVRRVLLLGEIPSQRCHQGDCGGGLSSAASGLKVSPNRRRSFASFGFGLAPRSMIATNSSQASAGSWKRVRSASRRLARSLVVSSLMRVMRSM